MNNLRFERPMAFIDLETTGLNTSSDRIVELTVLKVYPDGHEELKSHRINPGMSIPTEATEVHGITDADVADEPNFQKYAVSLRDFLDDCDIAGFNVIRYDLPLLKAEFRRVGVEFSSKGRHILDAQVVYHKFEPRDLTAAYRKYCGKDREEAHTSGGDVRAAAEVLDSQLAMYPELPKVVPELHEFCNPGQSDWVDDEGKFLWVDHEAVINIGKYKGQPLRELVEIDSEYLYWLINADFGDEVKDIVIRALNGQFPEPSDFD